MTLQEIIVYVDSWSKEDLVNFTIDRLYSELQGSRNVHFKDKSVASGYLAASFKIHGVEFNE